MGAYNPNTFGCGQLTPDFSFGATPLVVQNQLFDGTGTVLTVANAANAPNGIFVQRLRFKAAGANIQTVSRVFINNGKSNAVAANNILYGEITLPVIVLSQVAAQADIDYPINIALQVGYKINVVIGTTVASGWYVSAISGAI